MTDILTTLQAWFPAGRVIGNEYVTGPLSGGAGDSTRIDLSTGSWLAFADGNAGSDLTDLYAAIHNIPRLEAAFRMGNGSKPVAPAEPDPPLPAATAMIAPQSPSGDAGACKYCRTPLIAGGYQDYCNIRCAIADKPELAKPKQQPVAAVAAPQHKVAASGSSSGELVHAPATFVPAVDKGSRGRPSGKPALAVIEGGKARQPVSRMVHWQELGLYLTDKGTPAMNADNIDRLLAADPELSGKFWYDSFYRTVFTNWNGPKREFGETDCLHLTIYLQRERELTRATDELVWKGVQAYAHDEKKGIPRDSGVEWFESLVWDGVPRIDGFMHAICGAEPDQYTQDVSRMFWLSMPARVYTPGCKFDQMIVLEGAQGTYKSTLLQVIGGEWYKVPSDMISSKDFLMTLSGCMLVEMSELVNFRKDDANQIKKVLSDRLDFYREPYGRKVRKYPRQCVFVGTTNETRYLIDTTGNRRFWPIKCNGKIDIAKAKAEREQLFAEAAHEYKRITRHGTGEFNQDAWFIEPSNAAAEQQARVQYDTWVDTVTPWLAGRTETTITDILCNCLDMAVFKHDKMAQNRVGAILRQAGWENVQVKREGRRPWVWRSPNWQGELQTE